MIIAALIIAPPSKNPGPPAPLNIKIDAISGKWEQLSIMDARPIKEGYQFLWLKVKVTNGLDEDLIIAPVAFSVSGADGTKYNASDDDSQGIIPSGVSATFNLSIEAPYVLVPTTIAYTIGKEVFTDKAPSISAMVLDIVFSNIITTRNYTDSSGQNRSPEQVLHASFDLKNQWTKTIDTNNVTFTIVNATNEDYEGNLTTFIDTVSPGETVHFTIEFIIPYSYTPKNIRYDMGAFAPYGSGKL